MMFHIRFNIISVALSHSQLYAILDPQGMDQPLSTVANTMGDNLSIFPYHFSGQLPNAAFCPHPGISGEQGNGCPLPPSRKSTRQYIP